MEIRPRSCSDSVVDPVTNVPYYDAEIALSEEALAQLDLDELELFQAASGSPYKDGPENSFGVCDVAAKPPLSHSLIETSPMALRLAMPLCVVLFGGSVGAATDDTGSAMSLETIYQLAVSQAPSLAIAKYQLESAEAQAAVARGAVLPQVSLFGEWSENTLEYDGGALASQYGQQRYPGERYGFRFAKLSSTWRLLEKLNVGELCPIGQ